jgi:hypothetical protein
MFAIIMAILKRGFDLNGNMHFTQFFTKITDALLNGRRRSGIV